MRGQSIRMSILWVVTVSLLILATVMVIVLSRHESERIRENTRSLVREQIALAVNKLDAYRLVNQVSYVLKITFDLNRVNGVNIFDNKCNLVGKQPINFKVPWNCKSTPPESMVLYESDISISGSDGAPKYILAHLKKEPRLFLNTRSIKIILISSALILLTLLCLHFFMKRRILKPIDDLIKIIRKPGALKRNSKEQETLPAELREIYDDVLSRDEIIQQNKRELIKKNEMEVKSQISQQVAHDIRSPIMMLRDYHLKLHSVGKGQHSIYLDALNDLDILAKQLFENSDGYTKEFDLVGLIKAVIQMKQTEFQHHNPKVNIHFDSTCNIVKIKMDPTKLKFVLSNIINNSREASKKYKTCEIKIGLRKKGEIVTIEIVDNGKGIKMSNLPKVFDREVSINKPGGNGLGLSDAKKFIEGETGTIEIKSKRNKGSTVIITLPVVLSTFQSHGQRPFKHVLVEDYKLSQLLWLQEAADRGLSFAVFSSPSEFLNNLDTISDNAVLYLDSHFPDFPMLGENWAKELYHEKGFKKIYMCSTSEIAIDDKPWIMGRVPKNKPFEQFNKTQGEQNQGSSFIS